MTNDDEQGHADATDGRAIARDGECNCETAEELLAKLSPLHQLWQPNPPSWIFRGLGDVKYPLQAKAHRVGAFAEYGLECAPDADFARREAVMRMLLDRFRDALDRAGLPIPAPPPLGGSPMRIWGGGRISENEVPLLALAQHYDLPTPLLDWTSQARVAAYFAASKACEEPTDPGARLAVWAMRRDFVGDDKWITSGAGHFDAAFILVSAPRSSNPNLHAQSGILTWLWGREAHSRTFDGHIEAVADLYGAKLAEAGLKPPFMRRLSAPRSCARKLLRLLAYEGVDGSSMYPGYDGIARRLRERVLWDEPMPAEEEDDS